MRKVLFGELIDPGVVVGGEEVVRFAGFGFVALVEAPAGPNNDCGKVL